MLIFLMKNDDSTAVATKQDIALLMGTMGEMNISIQKLYDDTQLWKDEIMDHFEVVLENYRHDLAGANKDEITTLQHRSTDHEVRIQKLEVRPV